MIIFNDDKIKVEGKGILSVDISKTELNKLNNWNKSGNSNKRLKVHIRKDLNRDRDKYTYRLLFDRSYFLDEKGKKKTNITINLHERIRGKTIDPLVYKGFVYIKKKEFEVQGILCPNIYTHSFRYSGACTCDFRREKYKDRLTKAISSSANNMTIWKVIDVTIDQLLDWDLDQKDIIDLTSELRGNICKYKSIANKKFTSWKERNGISNSNILVNSNSTAKSLTLDNLDLMSLT